MSNLHSKRKPKYNLRRIGHPAKFVLLAASTLVFFTCSAFSQENTSFDNKGIGDSANVKKSLDQDQVTKTLFSDIEKMMVVEEVVAGRFTQHKYINVLPKPLLSKGVFSYEESSGLDWLTQTPIVSRLVFNDQGIRQDVEGNTVWEIDGMQPAVLSITRVMTGVLSGNWPVLSEYFEISGKVDSKSWQLNLTPKDEVITQLITSLQVSGDNTLQTLILFEANGDRTEISFTIDHSK